jgi:hypothetical protein
VIRQQNPADFNLAALAGSWAFSFQGFDPTNPVGGVGSYQQDSQGMVTNGDIDINDFGTSNQYTFTAHPTSGIDTNGRLTVNSPRSDGRASNVAEYVVSAHEVLYVEIDDPGYIITGAYLRQSAGLNNGSLNGIGVFRGSRQAGAQGNPHADAQVGTFTTDGAGHIAIVEDDNNGGTIAQQIRLSGNYAVSSNGRTPINLGQGSMITCYLIALNQGWCVNSSPGASIVYFEPQSAGPFSISSWAGEFLGGTLPSFVPGIFGQLDSIFTDGGGNLSSTYTQSGPGGTVPNQALNATYTISSIGHITISQGTNTLYLGYMVSPNKIDLISAASNPRTSIETRSSAP